MTFQLGIERWLADGGHRQAAAIGLVSHDAARLRDGRTVAEALHAACGSRLRALFGPEHGFNIRGGAGEPIGHTRHPQWDIPVWSLYGEHRKPSPAMLENLDLLVIDLHTLPFRPYTYLATLMNVMAAATEQQLPVVVADRPVPLPDTIDGPMPDAAQHGFVCPANLPMAYGMTPGETAAWLQAQRIPTCGLRIIPMRGYRRDATPQPDWPPWHCPSPAIRSWHGAGCYLITVFCEALPMFSNDRQGDQAFQCLYGPPAWQSARDRLIEAFDGREGLLIKPAPPESRSRRSGIRLQITDPQQLRPVTAAINILAILQQSMGARTMWRHRGARPEFFDRLMGTASVRERLQAGWPAAAITAAWETAQAAFRQQRRAALLYSQD